MRSQEMTGRHDPDELTIFFHKEVAHVAIHHLGGDLSHSSVGIAPNEGGARHVEDVSGRGTTAFCDGRYDVPFRHDAHDLVFLGHHTSTDVGRHEEACDVDEGRGMAVSWMRPTTRVP